MGDWAHVHLGTGVIGHMGISSLILQGSSPKFYCTYIWMYSFRIHSDFSIMAIIFEITGGFKNSSAPSLSDCPHYMCSDVMKLSHTHEGRNVSQGGQHGESNSNQIFSL